MDDVTSAPQVTDNQAAARFEIVSGGRLAGLRYRRVGRRLVLVHTGVPPELEGHGLGGALVAAAVDRAAREGLTVVPACPFARQWLERHADAAATVTVDWTAAGRGTSQPPAETAGPFASAVSRATQDPATALVTSPDTPGDVGDLPALPAMNR